MKTFQDFKNKIWLNNKDTVNNNIEKLYKLLWLEKLNFQ